MENCSNLEARVTKRNLIKDIFSEVLYNEFVPKWFKKRESKDMYLLPVFKLGIGVGLCVFSIKDMTHINVAEGIGGAYLLVDSIYQFLNEMSQSKRAATWAIDLITYPFYKMSSRYKTGTK